MTDRTIAVVAAVASLVAAIGFGLGMNALAAADTWRRDGDAPNTFYTRVAVDWPGLYIADEHYRGQHREVVQLVITGMSTGCRASMGGGQSYQELVDVGLPVVLVRRKENCGGWHYDLEGPPTPPRPPGP